MINNFAWGTHREGCDHQKLISHLAWPSVRQHPGIHWEKCSQHLVTVRQGLPDESLPHFAARKVSGVKLIRENFNDIETRRQTLPPCLPCCDMKWETTWSCQAGSYLLDCQLGFCDANARQFSTVTKVKGYCLTSDNHGDMQVVCWCANVNNPVTCKN